MPRTPMLLRKELTEKVVRQLDAEYERGRLDASSPNTRLYTAMDVRDLLRERCDEFSVASVARDIGIHKTHLSGILSGRFGIGRAVVRWLGLERVTVYRRPLSAAGPGTTQGSTHNSPTTRDQAPSTMHS